MDDFFAVVHHRSQLNYLFNKEKNHLRVILILWPTKYEMKISTQLSDSLQL